MADQKCAECKGTGQVVKQAAFGVFVTNEDGTLKMVPCPDCVAQVEDGPTEDEEASLRRLERNAWQALQSAKKAQQEALDLWMERHRKLEALVRLRPRRPDELMYAYAPCKQCGARLAYPEVGHDQAWVCSAELLAGTRPYQHEAYPFAFYSIKSDREYTQSLRETQDKKSGMDKSPVTLISEDEEQRTYVVNYSTESRRRDDAQRVGYFAMDIPPGAGGWEIFVDATPGADLTTIQHPANRVWVPVRRPEKPKEG